MEYHSQWNLFKYFPKILPKQEEKKEKLKQQLQELRVFERLLKFREAHFQKTP